MKTFEAKPAAKMRLALVAALGVSFVSPSSHAVTTQGNFVLADARPYRHCHNQPRRTYCHKKDRLPAVWPPFSDRQDPGKSRRKAPCSNAPADCADRNGHRLGGVVDPTDQR